MYDASPTIQSVSMPKKLVKYAQWGPGRDRSAITCWT